MLRNADTLSAYARGIPAAFGEAAVRLRRVPASRWIMGAVVGLTTLGLLMVYSATSASGGGTSFLRREIFWVLAGWIALSFVRRVDYRWWIRHSRVALVVCAVLLVGVLVPGIGAKVNGARRWYRFDWFSFQPSELAKFAIPLFLADFLARKAPRRMELFRGFVPPMAVLGTFFALLLCEPDFGTAALVSVVGAVMLLVGGVRPRYVAALAALAAPVFLAAILAAPYRLQRMTTFLAPWKDPQGKGYQIVQSQVAIGSGGVLGAGIGAGRQKLHYVPAMYADFILTQVGEELGLVGVTGLFAFFAALLHGCWRATREAPDAAASYLAFGILFTVGLQAVINVAVVIGMAPTKGIPLPLVSFGGSSLVACMAALGIVLNLCDQTEKTGAA